jgi:hypothetical protein
MTGAGVHAAATRNKTRNLSPLRGEIEFGQDASLAAICATCRP